MSVYHNRVDVGNVAAYPAVGAPSLAWPFDGKLVTLTNLSATDTIAVSFDAASDAVWLSPGTALQCVEFERQTAQQLYAKRLTGALGAGLLLDVVVEG